MQLIITEKPSVAMNICEALGISYRDRNKGFIEGENRIVSWCYGHLIGLSEPEAYGDQFKKWTYDTLPIFPDHWKYEVKPDTMVQFEVLKSLMGRDDVTEIINSCDAGREGELILRLVYEQAGCTKPIKRLWISSMESKAIRDGFENLRPGEEYDNLFSSAKCRQEADWLVGINGTRLFSVLYGKTLKVGRVQTPTLAMLVDREVEIGRFKKEPYYTVHLEGENIDAVSDHMGDKTAAEDLAARCDGKNANVISITNEDKSIPSLKLFDLTSLQREANKLFGFTAKQTLDYTQSLYEKRLVTYPRTDSRYLTDDMEETAKTVLDKAGTVFGFLIPATIKADYLKILNSKKVSDHHAIIPTTEIACADIGSIPDTEMKILSLIAMRLACAVSGKYCYTAVKAVISCEGENFTASGKSVTELGWKAIEESFRATYGLNGKKDDEDKELPELSEGQEIKEVKSRCVEGFTKPPAHFTEDILCVSKRWIYRKMTYRQPFKKGAG